MYIIYGTVQYILPLVACNALTTPANGMISCPPGDNGVLTVGETCTATCDTGYQVQDGDVVRTCDSEGSWSGSDVVCTIGMLILSLNPHDNKLFCEILREAMFRDTRSFIRIYFFIANLR